MITMMDAVDRVLAKHDGRGAELIVSSERMYAMIRGSYAGVDGSRVMMVITTEATDPLTIAVDGRLQHRREMCKVVKLETDVSRSTFGITLIGVNPDVGFYLAISGLSTTRVWASPSIDDLVTCRLEFMTPEVKHKSWLPRGLAPMQTWYLLLSVLLAALVLGSLFLKGCT